MEELCSEMLEHPILPQVEAERKLLNRGFFYPVVLLGRVIAEDKG
jgi:hypothetical protein